MAKIAFIGLGNMGGPMAANLAKAQHHVTAFDLSDAALDAAVEKGADKAASAAEAVKGAEIVVTMLPAGKHVREVYEKDVLPNVAKGALLIDCSTIDVDSARHVGELAKRPGSRWSMRRYRAASAAPRPARSPSWSAARGAFGKARPILEKMGKNIVHTGRRERAGGQDLQQHDPRHLDDRRQRRLHAGQAAGPRRAEAVRRRVDGVGRCWSVNNYLPVPGPVPASPANRDYQAGFTAAMMLKDLLLAQQAAQPRAPARRWARRQRSSSACSSMRATPPRTSRASSRCWTASRTMITLYDLAFDNDRRPSPFCWRAKFALKHKGLAWRDEPMGFTEKQKIAFAHSQTVPVIHDGPKVVKDSWAIAQHLDERLSGQAAVRAARHHAHFVTAWVDTAVHPALFPILVGDLYDRVRPVDQPYFLDCAASGWARPTSPGSRPRRARRAWPPSAPCSSRRAAC